LQKAKLFSHQDTFVKDHYRSGYQSQNWIQKKLDRDFIFFDLDKFYSAFREQILQLLFNKKLIHQSVLLADYSKADIMYENRGLRRQLNLIPGEYYDDKNAAELVHFLVIKPNHQSYIN
jgi:hypothetical protein